MPAPQNTPPTPLDRFFQVLFEDSGDNPLPQRPTIKVIGATLTDDSLNNRTILTVEGGTGSGGYATIETASATLPQRLILKILGNAAVTDDSMNASTDVTIGGLIEYSAATLPQRAKIQLLGTVTAVDNPGNNSTDVTVAGGAGGSLFGHFSARPGSAATGTQFAPDDGPVTSIYSGSGWDNLVSGTSVPAPPAAAGWTATSGGASGASPGTIADAQGTLLLTPGTRDTLYFPPSPDGSEITAIFDQSVNPNWSAFGGGSNPGYSIIVYNPSVTGTHKAYWRFGNYYDTSGVQHVQLQNFTGTGFPYGAGSSPVDQTGTPPLGGKYQYLRAVFNYPSTGNLSFFISANGIDWAIVNTQTTPFEDTPLGPLKLGVCALNSNPLGSFGRVYSCVVL